MVIGWAKDATPEAAYVAPIDPLLLLTFAGGGCGLGSPAPSGGGALLAAATGPPSVVAAHAGMQEVYHINVRIVETTQPETPEQRALQAERGPHLEIVFKAHKAMSADERQAFNDHWRPKLRMPASNNWSPSN